MILVADDGVFGAFEVPIDEDKMVSKHEEQAAWN